MESKEFWLIEDEAHHRLFKWVIDNKDHFLDHPVQERLEYWIAVVAQERVKK